MQFSYIHHQNVLKCKNQLQNLWIFLKYNSQGPSPSLQNPPRLSIILTSTPITLYLHSLLFRSLYTCLSCAPATMNVFHILENMGNIFLHLFLSLPYFHTHFTCHYDFAHGVPLPRMISLCLAFPTLNYPQILKIPGLISNSPRMNQSFQTPGCLKHCTHFFVL